MESKRNVKTKKKNQIKQKQKTPFCIFANLNVNTWIKDKVECVCRLYQIWAPYTGTTHADLRLSLGCIYSLLAQQGGAHR